MLTLRAREVIQLLADLCHEMIDVCISIQSRGLGRFYKELAFCGAFHSEEKNHSNVHQLKAYC